MNLNELLALQHKIQIKLKCVCVWVSERYPSGDWGQGTHSFPRLPSRDLINTSLPWQWRTHTMCMSPMGPPTLITKDVKDRGGEWRGMRGAKIKVGGLKDVSFHRVYCAALSVALLACFITKKRMTSQDWLLHAASATVLHILSVCVCIHNAVCLPGVALWS